MDGYAEHVFPSFSLSLFPLTIFNRHEFAKNEFVTSLECVTLETVSTESGVKDFLAVGTTINRGEDLAVRGAVSVWGTSV